MTVYSIHVGYSPIARTVDISIFARGLRSNLGFLVVSLDPTISFNDSDNKTNNKYIANMVMKSVYDIRLRHS